VNEDFTETNDLAARNPEKLRETDKPVVERSGEIQCTALDDRRYERGGRSTRPVASVKKDVYTYYPGLLWFIRSLYQT